MVCVPRPRTKSHPIRPATLERPRIYFAVLVGWALKYMITTWIVQIASIEPGYVADMKSGSLPSDLRYATSYQLTMIDLTQNAVDAR